MHTEIPHTTPSTAEDIQYFRQGYLPPAWRPKLEKLAQEMGTQISVSLLGEQEEIPSAERAQRLLADVAVGRVVAEDGQVIARPSRINSWLFLREFQGTGALVLWEPGSYLVPPLGRWRVYLLPTSRIAIGAEGWSSPPSDPGRPGPDHAVHHRAGLLVAQQLNEGQLAQLRAGKIPEKIAERLRQKSFSYLMLAIVFGGAGFLMLGKDMVRGYAPTQEC